MPCIKRPIILNRNARRIFIRPRTKLSFYDPFSPEKTLKAANPSLDPGGIQEEIEEQNKKDYIKGKDILSKIADEG
jgi:hypothetical protein